MAFGRHAVIAPDNAAYVFDCSAVAMEKLAGRMLPRRIPRSMLIDINHSFFFLKYISLGYN